MTKQANQPANNQLENVQEALSRSEQFIEKYQKQILIGVAAIAIVVSGILATRHFYILPTEKRAETALFKGEFYFAKDSFALALNGDDNGYIGFEGVIDQYSGTPSANLAKAYAGLCIMNMGEFEKAISYLEDFNADDNLVAPAIIGAIGDCYVELGKIDKAIEFFEKAAAKGNNDLISPVYLKKAGIAYESQNNFKGALKVYNELKKKYYASQEASDIDKYIERASGKL